MKTIIRTTLSILLLAGLTRTASASDVALWSVDTTDGIFSFPGLALKDGSPAQVQGSGNSRTVELMTFSNTVYNRRYRLMIVERRGRLHAMRYEQVGSRNRQTFSFGQIRSGADIFRGSFNVSIVSLRGPRLNRRTGGAASMRVLKHGSIRGLDYSNIPLEIYKAPAADQEQNPDGVWKIRYNGSSRVEFDHMTFHGNYDGEEQRADNAVGISRVELKVGGRRGRRVRNLRM